LHTLYYGLGLFPLISKTIKLFGMLGNQKTITFLLILLLAKIGIANAQQITKFTPTYCAVYEFKFVIDTNQRENKLVDEFLLFFNETESYFISKDRFYNDSLILATLGNTNNYAKISDPSLLFNKIAGQTRNSAINYLIYKNFKEKKVILTEAIQADNYQIIEPPFTNNWKLSNNPMNIAGLECNAAQLKFHGRDYTAYFTSSIPVSDGPYKFNGLPGLILHIEDSKKEVLFTIKSVRRVTYPVSFISRGEPITIDTKKLYELKVRHFLNPFSSQGGSMVRMDETEKAKLLQDRKEAIKRSNNLLEKE